MMKRFFLTLTLVFLALAVVAKKKHTEPRDPFSKGTGKVYVFGTSQVLMDSVLYITGINEIDSISLEGKGKFLPFRTDFSLQLKEYMEGRLHLSKQTVAVFFSDSRKKLSKKYYKIKKLYLDNPNTKIVLFDDRFVFRHPLDSYVKDEEKVDEAKEK